MNNTDIEYQRLLKLILSKGRKKNNRTGVRTLGVFGAQARFNLQEGFPLLTTKKIFSKGIIHELLWFISGSTNIKYLVDNGVNIWNKDAYRRYKEIGISPENYEWMKAVPLAKYGGTAGTFEKFTEEEFVNQIKTNENFAVKWGELGEGTYGGMWRDYPVNEFESGVKVLGVDQLYSAIEKLKTNPDDRRIIVNAWHPYYAERCVLPPCHVLFHFNTEELTVDERRIIGQERGAWSERDDDHTRDWTDEQIYKLMTDLRLPVRRLNCLMYQRSCDTFLGVPFNIASYALLTEMVAHCVNMVAGEFIHTYGDLHIYENHIKQVEEQLSREPLRLPKLKLNPNVRDLFAFKFEDIQIENYQSHPPIKGEMST
jgi:thymidylate synthase